MDENLEQDTARKLEELTENPDIDLHLRIQDHRLEGFAWCQGRRYRLIGVRDEEPADGPHRREPATGRDVMKEPHEEQTDVERGAAEEASGVPLTPTEEEASSRPPGDTGDKDE
jgi:hypothetical protein